MFLTTDIFTAVYRGACLESHGSGSEIFRDLAVYKQTGVCTVSLVWK